MAFELLDPTTWVVAAGGSGGGLLGFIAGQVRARGKRLTALESEVEECRKRDARFLVVEAGFRMVVGEMQRKDPNNEALKRTGDLLNRAYGGVAPPPSEFQGLLEQLDAVDPHYGSDDRAAD